MNRLLALLSLLAGAVVAFFVLEATVLAPADHHGAKVVHLTIESQAVGEERGVNVVEPADLGPDGDRTLLVFLHGYGGSDASYMEDEAVFEGLARLGPKAPVLAFPDGDDSYWHNRATGDWETFVIGEVIPTVVRRFGIDPRKVAIGGVSMGGFGAYHLALEHPDRFCAVGGHSAAIWFAGGETAPGAFDDAEDFERNSVYDAVKADPDAFGSMRVWNDFGDEDPFRVYNEGLVAALETGDADLTTHTWPGAHKQSYWDAHWAAYLRFYANALASCS